MGRHAPLSRGHVARTAAYHGREDVARPHLWCLRGSGLGRVTPRVVRGSPDLGDVVFRRDDPSIRPRRAEAPRPRRGSGQGTVAGGRDLGTITTGDRRAESARHACDVLSKTRGGGIGGLAIGQWLRVFCKTPSGFVGINGRLTPGCARRDPGLCCGTPLAFSLRVRGCQTPLAFSLHGHAAEELRPQVQEPGAPVTRFGACRLIRPSPTLRVRRMGHPLII